MQHEFVHTIDRVHERAGVLRFNNKPVYAGLNTAFIGILEERGVWTEKCAACGECVLHLYGGICPITRCAKKMLNGPCSGSREDRCEVGHIISATRTQLLKQEGIY